MNTDRRGFFRVLGSVMAFLSGRVAAEPVEPAPEIHTETRNTRFGAIGRKWPTGRAAPPFHEYPGKPVIALPAAQESGRSLAEVLRTFAPARGFVAEPISILELATLLHHSNGVTDSPRGRRGLARRRAAPSAGALYAGEVYVIAERVRGLEAGVYYYAVAEHQLKLLKKGSLLGEVGRALERPGEVENAAVAILLTNVFERYSRRYANRAYRYALIDSGHIGENLRLAASSSALVDASPQRFLDDALNELLGVDGHNEAVCALHVVGRGDGAKELEPLAVGRRFDEQQQLEPTDLSGPIPGRFHEATKLVPTAATVVAHDADTPALVQPSNAAGLKLPGSAPSGIRVATAIRRRRSAKAFNRLPVSLPDLSFVLEAAQGNPALTRQSGVEVYVAVSAVAGLEPGVYRYQPGAHQLVAVRKGEIRDAMVGACLGQKMAGSAAVGFAIAARLDGARSPLGDRRYRDLLLESGAIAQRIYLAAEAVDLAARNLAAYIDDRFNALLRLDQRGLFALHLTMLGNGD